MRALPSRAWIRALEQCRGPFGCITLWGSLHGAQGRELAQQIAIDMGHGKPQHGAGTGDVRCCMAC